MDVPAGHRDRTRDRGRKAAAAPHAGRQVGHELPGRPTVLRPRGAPAGAEEARRTRRRRRDQEEQELRLGAWIGNQRSRAATLSPERVELLSAIGMRWT
ncbi:helicase associated domain-containing protein [Streptomyces sp. NPDC056255]|uniref:helicase associated domain-containing protein n=1 Tax=Streptomyces sp. NPDC056255 TaxID=3345764 RepID=UPI0035E3AEA0